MKQQEVNSIMTWVIIVVLFVIIGGAYFMLTRPKAPKTATPPFPSMYGGPSGKGSSAVNVPKMVPPTTGSVPAPSGPTAETTKAPAGGVGQ